MACTVCLVGLTHVLCLSAGRERASRVTWPTSKSILSRCQFNFAATLTCDLLEHGFYGVVFAVGAEGRARRARS